MKREDIVGILPIFFIYLYFYLIQVYVTQPQLQQALGLAGIFLLVGLLVMQEAWVKIRYAGYKLLKGYILGAKEEYQWLIEGLEETSITDSDGRSKSAVILRLARPYHHREFGAVDKVILDMPRSTFESLDFTPLKNVLSIYGMDVDHPSVAYAILREESDVKVDHAKPIPVYRMVVSDKYEAPSKTMDNLLEGLKEGGGSVVKKLREELERAKKLYREMHQKVIRLEEENAGLRNEVQALLDSNKDVQKQAIELVLNYRDSSGDLRLAAKYLTKGALTSKILSRETLIAIVVLGLAGLLFWRKDLLFWLVSHPWHTLIIAISLAIVSYYTFKGLRGR